MVEENNKPVNVEEEKPIYKQKKGIIGIIVDVCCLGIILIAAGGMLSPDNSSTTADTTTDSNSNEKSVNTDDTSSSEDNSASSYGDGTYKVGSDIDPGEYKFTQTSEIGGYVERSSDSSMELDSIISNEATVEKGSTVYVTIKEGEYIKVQGGDLVKV